MATRPAPAGRMPRLRQGARLPSLTEQRPRLREHSYGLSVGELRAVGGELQRPLRGLLLGHHHLCLEGDCVLDAGGPAPVAVIRP